MSSYKKLVAWQAGMEVVKRIYLVTKSYPADETYGLTSQMRRAAISIPSNIAEGYRRTSMKERKHFLAIAMGSASELETQVIASREIGLLSFETAASAEQQIDRLQAVIYGLFRSTKAVPDPQ